jgi:MFS family permease
MSGMGDSLRESKTAMAEVFRNRNLRRLNLAFAGSVAGDWAYAIGVSVYAYTRGGATAVGALGVVRYVSMALLAPFTSLLADRFDRKRVMVVADAVRVVMVVAAALVIWRDGPPLAVYALAVGTAVAGTAFRPAQAALMPSLANHPGELTAANVAASTIESVGFFAGPAIGGLLIAVSGISAVYLFDAGTFIWSAALVLGLHPVGGTDMQPDAAEPAVLEPVVAEPVARKNPFAGVGDGYREIFRNRDIRLLVGLYCAQTVVAGASLVFGVAIALDLLKMGQGGVGVLNSAVGVGGLIGGFVALLLSQRGKLARDFGLGVILWAAPLLLIAAWPTLASALIALAVVGLANSVVDVNAFTILQRLVPDALMGRVFGAMESAIVGGMGLGALLMPLLINTIGLRAGLGVLGAAVTFVVLLGIGGLRRIDHVALAPAGLELLRGVAILGLLQENVLERLARGSRTVVVPSGQVVFREGDGGDLFHVIESGTVDVTIRGSYVRTLSVGDSFGEIALLRDIPRTATVTATSDLVTRAVDRDQFLPAVTGRGDAADQAEQVVSSLLAIR